MSPAFCIVSIFTLILHNTYVVAFNYGDFSASNLTYTNSSAYFNVTDKSDQNALQKANYDGISANITVPITYQTSNDSINNVTMWNIVQVRSQETIKETIMDKYPDIKKEQIISYKTSSYIISSLINSNLSIISLKTRIYTAFLAYSMKQLRDINKFTSQNEFSNDLETNLQETFLNQFISEIYSINVNINETTINNVKFDASELYNDADSEVDKTNEFQLLMIVIIIAVIIIIAVVCSMMYIMKKNNNKMVQKLQSIEKSLKQHNISYIPPSPAHPSASPVMYSISIKHHKRNQSKLEMQIDDKQISYKKISTYDDDNGNTPGDRNIKSIDLNYQDDTYLSATEDDTYDDMYDDHVKTNTVQ